MTGQYQGYMNGNAQSPGTNSFAQLPSVLNQTVNFGQQQQNPICTAGTDAAAKSVCAELHA